MSNQKTVMWVLLALAGAGAGACCLCGAGGALLFYMGQGRKVPPTARERASMLDVQYVASRLPIAVDPSKEKFTKTQHYDGSTELEYEYESDDPSQPVYIFSTIITQQNDREAPFAYSTTWSAFTLGMTLSGEDAQVEIRNDVFRWGEESKYGLVRANGRIGGFVFIARNGRQVVLCSVSGAATHDPRFYAPFAQEFVHRVQRY